MEINYILKDSYTENVRVINPFLNNNQIPLCISLKNY